MRCDLPALCPACEKLVCEKFFDWVSGHMEEYNDNVRAHASRFPDRYIVKEELVTAKKETKKRFVVINQDGTSAVMTEDEMNKKLQTLIGSRIFEVGAEFIVVLKLERKK